MPKIYNFNAIIKTLENVKGAFIEFPYDVKEEFGKGRVKVKASFDGLEYNGILAKWRTEKHILIIPKEIRNKLNKQENDNVFVIIEERAE